MPSPPLIDIAQRKTSDQVVDYALGRNNANVELFTAEAALTPNRAVKFGTGAGQVIHSAAAADLHLGVYIGDKAAAIGESVPIAVDGVVTAEAGAAIVQGAMLSTDAAGRVVTAAATNRLIGKALQAASGIGVKIKILLSDHSLVA